MAEIELSKQGKIKYFTTKTIRKIAKFGLKFTSIKKKKFKKSEVKSILFIQLYGIGDYLMSTPSIMEISQEFPNAEKRLLCKEFNSELAKLNPYLSGTIKREEVNQNIEKFDLVICLNESVEASIITKKLKPKYFIGFIRGNMVEANFDIVKQASEKNKSHLENYLLIAKALSIKFNKKENYNEYVLNVKPEKRIKKIIKTLRLKRFIIINPNTRLGAEAKNWGNENYGLLSNMLIKKGFQVVFCGDKNEENSEKTINLITHKKNVFDLTGKTTLSETAHLFSKAKLFVGNDTGLMHLAIAAKCPTIGLFGPTNSKIIFSKGKRNIALQTKCKNWPCYYSGTFDIKTNQKCMNTISPKNVFEKTMELTK